MFVCVPVCSGVGVDSVFDVGAFVGVDMGETVEAGVRVGMGVGLVEGVG